MTEQEIRGAAKGTRIEVSTADNALLGELSRFGFNPESMTSQKVVMRRDGPLGTEFGLAPSARDR